MGWKSDINHKFKINPSLVKSYFNRKQKLMFNKKSANKEESVLLKYINLNKNVRILDLGCGNGRWAFLLKDKIKKYVGVDFSSKFIEQARKKNSENHVEFLCMPAEEYKSEEKYDLILAIGLLTYMNDDSIIKLAANIKHMLSKRGILIVRNVTLSNDNVSRKYYDRKSNFFERLIGRQSYQVIRRSTDEEMKIFKNLKLVKKGFIKDTGYVFYVFRQ